MLSISIGPLALPAAPLAWLAAVWLASWAATRLHARTKELADAGQQADGDPGNTVLVAAGIGLAVARLAHLAANAPPYLAEPAAALDLRDGGWNAPAGVAAAAAWALWRGWRMPGHRRPLAVATAVAALTGGTGLAWLQAALPPAMPASTFTALAGGEPVTLTQVAAGRPAVVNLWASWCPPCREEMPALATAQQREPGVAFVLVNQGEQDGAVRRFLADSRLPLRDVLLDSGSRMGAEVGSRGLPTTLFYDRSGRLVDTHFGALNAAALEVRLAALRSNP